MIDTYRHINVLLNRTRYGDVACSSLICLVMNFLLLCGWLFVCLV